MVEYRKTRRRHNVWKRIVSSNMLPATEDHFYDSEWPEWLDRINAGFESEKKRLEKLTVGKSDDFVEALADDYWQAVQISSNMNAALIVSVWAKVEYLLQTLYRYCIKLVPPTKPLRPNPTVREYAEYFNDNFQINLQSLKCSQIANCLRVMSNAFKHHDSYYRPDSFPIDELLATTYRISKDCRIDYANLPLKEMILGSGIFCRELFCKVNEEYE